VGDGDDSFHPDRQAWIDQGFKQLFNHQWASGFGQAGGRYDRPAFVIRQMVADHRSNGLDSCEVTNPA
jgi:hypothetical protein